MFTWALDPVAFSIGPVAVRWYGIVYALGFLLAYFILKRQADQGTVKNLTGKLAEDFILLLMMGSILMSRLFYVVFYNPMYYLRHVLEIPAVWHGGLSIHGGFLGAVLVTWWFCKKHRINFYALADTLVVILAFVLIFGRVANFLNAELYGRVTDVAWCVNFPGADGCRHPSQLYEALYSLALFLILIAMRASARFSDGVQFWSFIALYGTFRFLVTFFREFDPTDPAILALSIGQWLSILMILVAGWWFLMMRKTGHAFVKKSAK
jgi:phosphatidylglycerol:prolipoprotein diacylglycerol transferase